MQPLDLGWLVAGTGAVVSAGALLASFARSAIRRRHERDAELRRHAADAQWWADHPNIRRRVEHTDHAERSRLDADRRMAVRNRQVVAERLADWIEEQATLTLAEPMPMQPAATPVRDPDSELLDDRGGILISAKGAPGHAPGSGRGATIKADRIQHFHRGL